MNTNIKREEDKKTKNKSKKKDTFTEYKESKELNLKEVNLTEIKRRRKRRELSCSANNSLNKHKFSITLEFE